MTKKGAILIIDDNPEEKVGRFEYLLEEAGYNIEVAKTLEEAERKYGALMEKNILDGLILDFSFPTNSTNLSVYTDGMLNGIYFLKSNAFKLGLTGMPVIINSNMERRRKGSTFKSI